MSDGREEDTEPHGIDLWIRPFFQDSTLWPVLAVLVICLSTIGGTVLLAALKSQNLFALAALVLLIWMSGDIVIRARRNHTNQLLAWCILALWLGSVAAAVIGISAGIA